MGKLKLSCLLVFKWVNPPYILPTSVLCFFFQILWSSAITNFILLNVVAIGHKVRATKVSFKKAKPRRSGETKCVVLFYIINLFYIDLPQLLAFNFHSKYILFYIIYEIIFLVLYFICLRKNFCSQILFTDTNMITMSMYNNPCVFRAQ